MEVKEAGANFASLSELLADTTSPGYKLTEVGVVPEDWEISTVGAEFFVQLGKMLDAEKNVGISKPFLGNRAVQWGRVDPTCIGQMKLTARDLQRYRLRDGDLLVCEGGEVGRAAIWRNEIDECYYQKALHRLRSKRGYSPTLMLNVLRKHAASGVLQNFVTQTSIAHLPKDKFEEVPIPLPGKVEQVAIAAALSDADTLIESLEQLIAKKRQIKQGAMQALLTGKRRLPGFGENWSRKTLSELFDFSGGYSASRDQLSVGGHCYLHYGDIHTSSKSFIDVGAESQKLPRLDISINKVNTHSLLKDGDVVFVDASEDDEGTSKHVVIINKDNAPFISGLHTIVAKSKTNELDHAFRRYCFQTHDIKQQFRFFAVGTKVSGVSKSNIGKIELSFPTVTEQRAIATILADMDTELAELGTRLARTRQLKQGMMQQLLTGRIRLV